jgi:hypothetical protein
MGESAHEWRVPVMSRLRQLTQGSPDAAGADQPAPAGIP